MGSRSLRPPRRFYAEVAWRGQPLRLLVLNAALEDVLHDNSRAGGDPPIAVAAQRHTRPGRGCGTIAGEGEET